MQTERALEDRLSPDPEIITNSPSLQMAVINYWGPSSPTALKKKTILILGGGGGEEEPQVTRDVAGKPIDLLIHIRATCPFLTVHAGLISSETCLVVKTNRAPRFGLVLSPFLASGPYRRGKVK